MSTYSGYIFVIDEERRASRIESYISAAGTFTDTISVPDLQTKRAEIFFISLGGHSIRYAALAHRGKTVATEKRQIRFTNFVEFSPPVPFRQVQELLNTRLQAYFIRASSGIGARVTPKTWEDMVAVIKHLRPQSAEGLERLEKLREIGPSLFSKPGAEVLAEERDAVNLALRMSGFDHREILNWSPSDEEELPPFLQGLPKENLIEDQMVAHDAEVFGDWERLKRYKVGFAVFRKRTARLTIMNVNRHKIERTLGVDLLYYHDSYKSYVMVQYKRMLKNKDEGEAVYRLGDKSYHDELRRMQEFEGLLMKAKPHLLFDLNDYRLHSGTAYFKLCPAEVIDLTSTDMIKGMYIPLDYWELLLKSPKTVGPKGGKQLTFDNVERYFNNTLFVELVQAGWIGSKLMQTAALTDLVRSAIKNNKSVILASLQMQTINPDQNPS
jgi:hypothetical protein